MDEALENLMKTGGKLVPFVPYEDYPVCDAATKLVGEPVKKRARLIDDDDEMHVRIAQPPVAERLVSHVHDRIDVEKQDARVCLLL